MGAGACARLGETLGTWYQSHMGETRIQLCGPLAVRVDGARVEGRLPGRQGRLLLARLVEGRRPATRDELVRVLWGDVVPDAADSALSALLSKLRRLVPVEGRSDVRIALPDGSFVDVHAAREALHRAESAAAREDWTGAWGPARVAQHIGERPFLVGDTSAWAAAQQRAHEALHVRALELAGLASLRIGGGELATAERTARRLVEQAPLRESGTRILMEVLAAQGNRAEALVEYDVLRLRLRAELGVAPSPETQRAHRDLLG
jgi:DNA-binding SARP family transcriptional activator